MNNGNENNGNANYIEGYSIYQDPEHYKEVWEWVVVIERGLKVNKLVKKMLKVKL